MVNLENVTSMNWNRIPSLEYNNITATLQKGGRGSGWFTAEEKSYTNTSINFLNVDKSTHYTEDNAYSIIYISVSESTLDNGYIHILYGMSKEYMYGYLI